MGKILVTGANGFVGAELCSALRRRGDAVVGAVRKNARADQCDVGNLGGSTDWTHALAGCDVIIHLAARVHVMKDKAADPLRDYREVNVDATVNLARQGAVLGVKRFVFVSSIKVNGEETSARAFTPQDVPAPVDPYGQSKLEAERALTKISRETGMELVIVRPPLVYGPGVKANFLRLMQLVRRGWPLPFGGMRNRRSMVALDNLVDLLIVCARHPAAAGRVFMVSDDDDQSIASLITLMARAMDKRALLLPVPQQLISSAASALGKSAVASRLLGSLQVDITDTRKVLGWQPVITTEKAVQKTVASFLNQGSATPS